MLRDLTFAIPGKFAAGLLDGSIVRYGTVLKHSGTGRILAHVQETGLAQQLIGKFGPHSFTPVGAIATALDVVSSVYGNVQLHQLKGQIHQLTGMVQALQVLQYANLGVAAAGLGVSAVGFALINRRLKGLKTDIDQLSARMEIRFKEIESIMWREHFSKIQVFVDRADRAFQLSEPKGEWLKIEEALNVESGFLAHTVQEHLDGNHFDAEWFQRLTTSLLLCDAVRINSLMQAEELKLAQSTAKAIGGTYTGLFDAISVNRLADRMTRSAHDSSMDDQALFRKHQDSARTITSNLQEVTNTAISKPLLIDHLIERGVSGKAYLEDIAAFDQHPLILLTP
jgi:hypothetical protein